MSSFRRFIDAKMQFSWNHFEDLFITSEVFKFFSLEGFYIFIIKFGTIS